MKKSQDFKNILITGGAGFIGSALIRKLLIESSANIINIDNLNYASDLSRINSLKSYNKRHQHINLDLSDDINE